MRKFPLSYGMHYEDALGFGRGGGGAGKGGVGRGNIREITTPPTRIRFCCPLLKKFNIKNTYK